MINNTVAKNIGAGINADGYDAAAKIVNNIVVGTPALNVGTFNDNNPPIVQYNDIYSPTGSNAYSGAIANLTGTLGNISSNPLVTCDPSDDDHLLAQSPCIDVGNNGADLLPSVDFDGNPRIINAGTNSVDLGAYEFNPLNPPTPCMYVNCPSNMTVIAPAGQSSVVVNFPPPTGMPLATLSSSPASGSVFPAGTNVVTCTATYGTNSAYCSFTITVIISPTITTQPTNLTVQAGQAIQLSVGASGSAPLTYSWTFEGKAISGATSSSLLVTNAQAINEGIYRAIVSNAAGSVTSSLAYVRVDPAPPAIVTAPASLVLPASSNATFSVVASGSQPFAYQWFFGNAPIAGATSNRLTLTNIQSANVGSYSVVVTNGAGSITSSAATLTVTPLLAYFTVQPVGGTSAAGTSRTFTALARGSEPISYQWQRNGTALTGATQTALVLTNLSSSDAGSYTAVASNTVGTTTSSAAVLVVNPNPVLSQALTNVVVDTGATVTLTATVTATPAATLVWQLNGTPIATNTSSITITNIQTSQAGYYRLIGSNASGTVTTTCRVSVFGPTSFAIAWGDDSGGQTNVPPLSDIVAIAGGDYHSIALRRNGTVAGWGYNGDGQATPPTNALRFVAIAAGASHNLALLENGAVTAWGRNDLGQANVPATATNVLALAAGDSHSLALLSTGAVIGWGDNSFGQISIPGGLTSVRAIAAGRNHSLALRANGTVVAWGYNANGQATVPPTLTNVIAIAAGYLHSAALLSNGTVVVWGDDTYHQTDVPVDATNVVAIAAGDFHTAALRADGSIVSWGDDSYGQLDVPATVVNAFAIASGNYHVLALQPTPVLMMSVSSGNQLLQWSGPGVLQWAPSVVGPYSDIVGPQGTFTNTDHSIPVKFFRLRR